MDCWGSPPADYSYGQAVDQAGPFIQIGAGMFHNCGLKPDGSVHCWGDTRYVGTVDQSGPFTQVSVGAYYTCGLKADGSADCWGEYASDQPADPAHPFTQVSPGWYHACGVKSDGSLECWEGGMDGQSPRLALAPASLPGGAQGVGYNQTLSASGGTSPYTYQVTSGSLPPGLSLGSNGTLSGTPTAGSVYTFDAYVIDSGSGLRLSHRQSYSVAINAAPVLAPIGNKIVNEGSLLSFTATATDSDLPANTLTYAINGSPANATFNTASGAFAWTPAEAQGPDSYALTITVSDGKGSSDSETFTITVNEVNQVPVLAAIGNQSINEGSLLSFTATATDGDEPANTRAFSLVGAPGGASIDPASGVFTWMPTEAQGPGSYPITITVTDNGVPAGIGQEKITVTVAEVNQAPQAAGDRYTVNKDMPLRVPAPGLMGNDNDPDLPANLLTSQPLTVPAHGLLDLHPDGSFVYTPGLNYYGQDTFTYLLSDGVLTSTTQVTLTVTSVDDPPLVDAGADLTGAQEGASVTFTGSYQEILRPAAARTPASAGVLWSFGDGASVSGVLTSDVLTSGVLTTTHVYADNGVFTATLTVTSSNGLAASDTRLIRVDNVAPSVQAGAGGIVLNGLPFTFAGAFTDPGADTHTFAWDFGDGSPIYQGTATSGALTPQYVYTVPGDYTARLTVKDDEGASGSAEVVVHVVSSIDIGGGVWSNPITTTSPCGSIFLGEFGNQMVSLRFGEGRLGQPTALDQPVAPLPAHSRVRVSFDLYIIRSWDGNPGPLGPDQWSLQASGSDDRAATTLLHTTFSNWDPVRFPGARQAFPGPFASGDYPAQTGATLRGGLCYSYQGQPGMDSIYHLSYTFDHSAPTLSLDFSAARLQEISDESWGLANVQVSLLGLAAPARALYLPVMQK